MARRFDLVAYLKLFRFPLVFTAIADSAAGYLICDNGKQVRSSSLWLLAIASGCLYMFGMALNDLADLEKDRQNAPGKVLPSGRVSRKGAIISIGILLFLSLLATCLIPDTPLMSRLPVWGCIVLAILAYDLHWVKAPPIMGLVRFFNFMLGVSSGMRLDGPQKDLWMLAVYVLPLFVYGTALTYVSTLEDEALNRRKLILGVSFMGLGALSAAVILPTMFYALTTFDNFASSWKSLGVAWILVAWIVYRAVKARDRKGLMLLVRDGVAGYILVDGALVLSFVDNPLAGVLVLALVIPAAISLYVFKRLA